MYLLIFFLSLFTAFSSNAISETATPEKYYLSFENFDFKNQDWVEQSKFKTIDERKWELVEGRFGKALYLGAVPLDYDDDNMSGLDLDLVTAVIFNVGFLKMKGRGYDEPFIWGAGKLHPGYGALSFWVKGSSVPANKNQRNVLFEQTTTGWGRKERQLMEFELLTDGSITGYVEDARYSQHAIKTNKIWNEKNWNHLVINWDKSSGLSVWINGKEAASTMGTDAWWENQLPGLFHLPMSKAAYDEFRIFDRTLNAEEIKSLYRNNTLPDKIKGKKDIAVKIDNERLKKAFISDTSKLVVITPSKGVYKTFKEITPENIQDEGMHGWWISDGRYELAAPHEYSVFTVIPGDVDYHAEKADIMPPADTEINYITFEGNLDGVDVHKGNRNGSFEKTPFISVPKTTAFFYGSSCENIGNSELRIPFTKNYGTPPGFSSDGNVLNLPLSGDLRLHEVSIFNVSEKVLKKESGDIVLGVSSQQPYLNDRKYPTALNALFISKDKGTAGLFDSIKPGSESVIDIPAMNKFHLLSSSFPIKTCTNSISIDLWVKSPCNGNVIQFRLRDPGVPSHTWAHAEVKLDGFTGEFARLSVALEFDPLFLSAGDRLWIEILSTDGITILSGNAEKYSKVTLKKVTEWVKAEPAYALKALRPNILTYGRSFEYIPWEWDKKLPDVNAPENFGGMFDMAYPWQAVLKNIPGDRLGNIYKSFGTLEFLHGHYPVENMDVKDRKIDAPANAPLWAVYFREIQSFRTKIINWWTVHQRSDGQVGGGWNDDTLIFSRSFEDLCIDSEYPALSLYNKVFDGFETTNYFKDGYCRIYPIDRLHNGDFVRERFKSLIFNLGDPRSALWAMEEAWHWKKPDKTPYNYSDGRGFLFGKDVLEWYWGRKKSENPFSIENSKELIENMRKAAVTNNDTCLWRYTDAWIHTDDQSPNGVKELNQIVSGGLIDYKELATRKDDSQVTVAIGVGWLKGGGPQLARMVEYSGNDSLKISMYSFDEFPRPVEARLYRLSPGKYSLKIKADTDSDGSYETIVTGRELQFERFQVLPFTVPARIPVVLEMKLIKPDPPAGDLPDLAISNFYIKKTGDDIEITVFNIGSKESGSFKITAACPCDKEIQTITVLPIGSASDFVPKSAKVVFKNLPRHPEYHFIIDKGNDIKEIYKGNNTAVFVTGNL